MRAPVPKDIRKIIEAIGRDGQFDELALPGNILEQEFVNDVDNRYVLVGYGRMLQIISYLWRRKSGDGAHCVTDTFFGFKRKIERCRKEGHDFPKGSNWCDRCGANV